MVGTYGARVRRRRALLGLSPRALAAASGITQPMVSAIEAGRRAPTMSVQAALDSALEVTPSVALRASREEVLAAIRRHGGTGRGLIGSVAQGTDRPTSDLDLLVDFEPGRDIVDLLALEDELAVLLTVDVDVVSSGSSGRMARRP